MSNIQAPETEALYRYQVEEQHYKCFSTPGEAIAAFQHDLVVWTLRGGFKPANLEILCDEWLPINHSSVCHHCHWPLSTRNHKDCREVEDDAWRGEFALYQDLRAGLHS